MYINVVKLEANQICPQKRLYFLFKFPVNCLEMYRECSKYYNL